MENKKVKHFCSAGNCWCDRMKGNDGRCNSTKSPNSHCDGVFYDNERVHGHGGYGHFFICKGYCPFSDKEHTKLNERAINEGYIYIEELRRKNEL